MIRWSSLKTLGGSVYHTLQSNSLGPEGYLRFDDWKKLCDHLDIADSIHSIHTTENGFILYSKNMMMTYIHHDYGERIIELTNDVKGRVAYPGYLEKLTRQLIDIPPIKGRTVRKFR